MMRGFAREYPLTALLLLANLLFYLLSAFCSGRIGSIDNRTLVECGALFGPAVVRGGEWWRLMSAMFLHAGLEHLALNMVSLVIVGRMVERYFSRRCMLVIYLAAGVTGFLFSLFVHPDSVAVGASGAIFGLFGAMGGYALFHRRRLGERYRIFMKEFGAILGLNLLLGILIPGIDMSAHIGGLLLGCVGGYLAIRNRNALWVFLGGVALASVWGVMSWLPGYFAIQSVLL